MSRATDSEIVAEARRTGEVIITHDLDYGHLLAFSGEQAPSFGPEICERMKSYFESIRSGTISSRIFSTEQLFHSQTKTFVYESCPLNPNKATAREISRAV